MMIAKFVMIGALSLMGAYRPAAQGELPVDLPTLILYMASGAVIALVSWLLDKVPAFVQADSRVKPLITGAISMGLTLLGVWLKANVSADVVAAANPYVIGALVIFNQVVGQISREQRKVDAVRNVP